MVALVIDVKCGVKLTITYIYKAINYISYIIMRVDLAEYMYTEEGGVCRRSCLVRLLEAWTLIAY